MTEEQFKEIFKGSTILNYLEFIDWDGEERECFETGMTVTEIIEQVNELPDNLLAPFPSNHWNEIEIFLAYYKYMWFTTLVRENIQTNPIFSVAKDIIYLRRKLDPHKKSKLERITFKFSGKYGNNDSFFIDSNNDYLMRRITTAINEVFDEFPITHNEFWKNEPLQKTGKKSQFISNYIDSLYPFVFYLKNEVFPDEPLEGANGIYQLIIDTIGLNIIDATYLCTTLKIPYEIISDTLKERFKHKTSKKLPIRK